MMKAISFIFVVFLLWCIVSVTSNLGRIVARLDTQNLMLDTVTKHFYKFAKDVDLVEAIKKRNEKLIRRAVNIREAAAKLDVVGD